MRTLSILAASAALLVCLACEPRVATPIYGPWEEGLTLAFEDPSLPQPQRSAERLQVRVAHSSIAPGSPRLVQLDLANTRGQMSLLLRHLDGGIALIETDGRVMAVSLPPHFPDAAPWVDRGTEFRVIGRARWEGAAILPPTSDPIGVWVEARSLQGPRRRTLYLPNLGEVESQVERDGTWVAVNRLVARGFTDLPYTKRP
jgi:hypothetical protein